MIHTTRNIIVVSILAAAVILASARPAHACSVSGEPPSIKETVDDADIVVIAQVIGTDGFPALRAALLVEKYLKGSGPEILFSEGYGSGGGDRDNAVTLWQRGIFYLDGNLAFSETLVASYSYPYYAVHHISSDTVREIVKLTGHDEYPKRSSFKLNIRAFGMSLYGIFNPYVYVIGWVVFLPLLIITAAILLIRYLFRLLFAPRNA